MVGKSKHGVNRRHEAVGEARDTRVEGGLTLLAASGFLPRQHRFQFGKVINERLEIGYYNGRGFEAVSNFLPTLENLGDNQEGQQGYG